MSLDSRESGTLKGSEDCQTDFPDCDFIVLDTTGNRDGTDDEIIFEKEVLGSFSSNPPVRCKSRTSHVSERAPDKDADDIEIVCLSSQESSYCASLDETREKKGEEEECQIIAISSELSSITEIHFKVADSLADSELTAEEPSKLLLIEASIAKSPAGVTLPKDTLQITSVDNEEVAASEVPKDPVPDASVVTKESPCSTKSEEDNGNCSSTKSSDELDDGEIELVIEPDLFCVDRKPDSSEENKEKKLAPRFRREFNTTLKHEEKPRSDEDFPKVNYNRCFNCLGNHTLAECPNPKNQQEINKNRAACRNQPKLTNRYHEVKEDRFGHFKPGEISDPLRRALGLRSEDVPMHIYRMRLLGYPPGWVEEMKGYSSGLEFIDTPNSPDRGDTIQTISFDFSRLIDYPGFNVPLSSRYRDDWQYLSMPPMQPYHSKENFIEQLKRHIHEHNNAPRSKRIRFTSENAEEPPNLEIVDMEMEDENDATIEDLEEKRMALLAQLQEQGSNSSCSKESGEIPLISLDENDGAGEKTGDAPPASDATDTIEVVPTSPKSSKLLEVGTPVAIRHSSFSSLPDRDKFAKGMGDLELFENLPNSTGTFQKMRSLLEKVRRAFKKS